VLVDERTAVNMAVLDRVSDERAIAPMIWPLEVANSLSMALRRGRTTTAMRDRALSDLQKMEVAIDDETLSHAWQATVALADLHGLTVYDASYLELAQRRRLPLASLDKALIAAAVRSGVAVMP
jgi:predicted nucleic acid-binding protein